MALFKKKKPGRHKEAGFGENTGTHYRKVLENLFKRRAPEWYLEIGSRDGRSLSLCPCNYIAIDIEFKVEHDTFNSAQQMMFFQQSSDDFFASGFLSRNDITPDLAFVDGLHHFEFALRDFMNCERNMKPGGLVCLHDVSPYNAAMTTRDTDYTNVLKRPWTGDVWKVIAALLDYRPDLEINVLNAEATGLGCIENLDPANNTLFESYDEIVEKYMDADLAEIGPEVYFGRFSLTDADAYLARQGQ